MWELLTQNQGHNSSSQMMGRYFCWNYHFAVVSSLFSPPKYRLPLFWGVFAIFTTLQDTKSVISKERIKVEGHILLKKAVSGVPSKLCADPFSMGCSVYLADYFSRISFLSLFFFFPWPFSRKKVSVGFSRACTMQLNAFFITDPPSLCHQLTLLWKRGRKPLLQCLLLLKEFSSSRWRWARGNSQ